MEIQKEKYSISELSGILQITDHALRFYEKEFCIKVPKDSRGRRFYTAELSNIMYQIKTMRSEGLEIKAIRKILQSEDIIQEPPPVVSENTADMMAIALRESNQSSMRTYFSEFKEQMTSEIFNEIAVSRDYLAKEITKSKLELGASVENGMRRIESKMEKHFTDVDKALGLWRERNKKNIFKKMLNQTFRSI